MPEAVPSQHQRIVGPLRVLSAAVTLLYVWLGAFLHIHWGLVLLLAAFGLLYGLVAVLPQRWLEPLADWWGLALTVVWCTALFGFGPAAVPGWATLVIMGMAALAPLPTLHRTLQVVLWSPLLVHCDASGAALLVSAAGLGWWTSWHRHRAWNDLLNTEDTLVGLYRTLSRVRTSEPAPSREAGPTLPPLPLEAPNLEELERHDRMAALGRLAVGVGHEINNPLTVAMMNVELLQKELPAEELLGEVQEALVRIRTIVGDLARLARPGAEDLSSLPLTELVESAVDVVRMGLKGTVRVELVDLPTIHVRAMTNRFDQVIVNLVVNAAHAIQEVRESGTVRVSAEVEEAVLYLHVDDDGPGIPEENFETVFQPFFTTKEVGKGTGLGLALARGYMREMGGDLLASRSPLGGARFTLSLQRAVAAQSEPLRGVSQSPSTKPILRARMTGERPILLLVDDDAGLRRSLVRTLSDVWDVVAVGNAKDAVAAVRQRAMSAVLCDLDLGSEDAIDVLGQIHEVAPDLLRHTVLMTGAPASGRLWSLAQSNHDWLVRKPFRTEVLRKLLGDAYLGHDGIELVVDPSAAAHSPASLPPWKAARSINTEGS